MACGICGATIEEDARFCGSCGTPRPLGSADTPGAPAAASPGGPRVTPSSAPSSRLRGSLGAAGDAANPATPVATTAPVAEDPSPAAPPAKPRTTPTYIANATPPVADRAELAPVPSPAPPPPPATPFVPSKPWPPASLPDETVAPSKEAVLYSAVRDTEHVDDRAGASTTPAGPAGETDLSTLLPWAVGIGGGILAGLVSLALGLTLIAPLFLLIGLLAALAFVHWQSAGDGAPGFSLPWSSGGSGATTASGTVTAKALKPPKPPKPPSARSLAKAKRQRLQREGLTIPLSPEEAVAQAVSLLGARQAVVNSVTATTVTGMVVTKKRPSILLALFLFWLCFIPAVIYMISGSKDVTESFAMRFEASGDGTRIFATGQGRALRAAIDTLVALDRWA